MRREEGRGWWLVVCGSGGVVGGNNVEINTSINIETIDYLLTNIVIFS